jgi:S-disulfanyl-L-cysteine oxidoreductase SoxD
LRRNSAASVRVWNHVMGLAWPAIVVVCALPISLVAQIGPPQQNARSMSSVWDGVYTAAQAERGKQVYVGHCARCHGDDLANSRNPLSGDRFAEHWESRTLADLFHRIRDTMPPGEASTVGETDKLDAVAYLLKQNGFPEGRAELPSDGDTLATIQITGKGGPIPVRTGTLVRTTGCLELRDDREWQLTSATEPARTALDTASKTSSRQDSPQSNARTIVLLNPFPSPAAHRGHRVAATGFLVRRADGDAVNVVSLEMLAPSCMP